MSSLRDQLSSLMISVDPPSRMTIINPYTRQPVRGKDNEDTAWVEVLSESSGPGRAFLRDQTDQIMMRKGRVARSEDLEANLSDKAARLTVGWHLLGLDGGAPLPIPFSLGNARDLYAMPEMAWLRDQVLEHAADLGNWRQTSLTTSSHTQSTNSVSTESA
jgi:hypothetical protein